MTDSEKHSSLLQYGKNYCRNKFYSKGHENVLKWFYNLIKITHLTLLVIFSLPVPLVGFEFLILGLVIECSTALLQEPWKSLYLHICELLADNLIKEMPLIYFVHFKAIVQVTSVVIVFSAQKKLILKCTSLLS
jgi:hypothetical protein